MCIIMCMCVCVCVCVCVCAWACACVCVRGLVHVPSNSSGMMPSHSSSSACWYNTTSVMMLPATGSSQLLALIKAQPLCGWMKLWLLDSYVVSKLQWMPTIYDFLLTFATTLENSCVRLAKRWLGLPPTAPPDVLHASHARHQCKEVKTATGCQNDGLTCASSAW